MEDDHDTLDAMAELVGDEGFEVETARDGEEALEYLRGGARPEAVLLDCHMPKMRGDDVVAAMASDPALGRIPVVWITGSSRPPPSSVVGYLRKPFPLAELIAMLKRVCARAA